MNTINRSINSQYLGELSNQIIPLENNKYPPKITELEDTLFLDLLGNKKIRINGSAGLVGSHTLIRLIKTGANIKASCYPNIPEDLSNKQPDNLLTINVRDVLSCKDNLLDMKGTDVYLHYAGIPIHYAHPAKAPEIFAVDALGSALVALAAHTENKRRNSLGKPNLRLIMLSSISALWMENYLFSLLNSEKAGEYNQGLALQNWLITATKDFVEYSIAYDGDLDPRPPLEFVNDYLSKKQGLLDITEELSHFDYYAFSKLLMDKILESLLKKELLENTIVLRPVSLLGTGLQNKDATPFIAKMVSLLSNGESGTLWRDRKGYYLPLSTYFEILKCLILIPEEQIKKLEFINLPGRSISQGDLYDKYIKPAVKNCLKEKGFYLDSLGDLIVDDNIGIPIDANREVNMQEIPSFIRPYHQISDELLSNTVKEITREIVTEIELPGYLADRLAS